MQVAQLPNVPAMGNGAAMLAVLTGFRAEMTEMRMEMRAEMKVRRMEMTEMRMEIRAELKEKRMERRAETKEMRVEMREMRVEIGKLAASQRGGWRWTWPTSGPW